MLSIHATIRKDQYAAAFPYGLRSPLAKRFNGCRQSFFSIRNWKQHGQGDCPEVSHRNMPDLLQLNVRQDGAGKFEHMTVFGSFSQKILLTANVTFQGHHHFLADGVNGRIGYLSEKLFEIVINELRPAGEHCQRGVGAHGTYCLFAVFSHGGH